MFSTDPAARKAVPVYSGCLRYFPSALAKVAEHSAKGNAQHNLGSAELFHDRSKSGDELDALMRHLLEGDLVAVAWRALSALQKQCEAEGSPVAPAARNVVRQGLREALDAFEFGQSIYAKSNPPATEDGS